MANQLKAYTYRTFSRGKISTVGFVTYVSIKFVSKAISLDPSTTFYIMFC